MTTTTTKHKIEIHYERLTNYSSAYVEAHYAMVGYIARGSLSFKSRDEIQHIYSGEVYTLTPENYMVLKQTDDIGIFEHVILYIDRRAFMGKEFAKDVYISPEDERMDKAILEGITKNLSIDALASICCMTASTFKRRFRSIFGASPHVWFMDRRMEIAEHLLINSEMKMRDIGRACGFVNDAHFSYYFKKRYGQTPSELRRNRDLCICLKQQIFSL